MAFTFIEFLRRRDPTVYRELSDLGFPDLDLGVDANKQAFLAAAAADPKIGKKGLQRAATAAMAKPNAKPTPAQVAADATQATQQAVLAGKQAPPDMDPALFKQAMQVMTPSGVPNDIGKQKAPDIARTIAQAGEKGYVPTGVEKFAPPGLKIPSYKPVASKVDSTPDAKGQKKATPSEIAAEKSKPKIQV